MVCGLASGFCHSAVTGLMLSVCPCVLPLVAEDPLWCLHLLMDTWVVPPLLLGAVPPGNVCAQGFV